MDELLRVKAPKVSKIHLKDMEGRLMRFAKRHGDKPINEITGPLLEEYINAIKGSPRTQLNNLRHVSTLLRFAARRKHLDRASLDETLEYVERPKEVHAMVSIFSPAVMRGILDSARQEMIPFIAIGGFAGLRTAEIARLDWGSIDLEEKHIALEAEKSKTRSRRVVPILTDRSLG